MDYTLSMNFEWDEAKSEACFRERCFDFAFAARVFFDPNRLVEEDTRHSYGEERYEVTGRIDGRFLVIGIERLSSEPDNHPNLSSLPHWIGK